MFDTLPIEVSEMVVRLLELQDLCNLRASSRAVASMTSNGRFRTYFIKKSVALNKNSLTALKHMLCHSKLARSLRDLVLASPRKIEGIGGLQKERYRLSSLLKSVFTTLRDKLHGGLLKSLHLSMSPVFLPPGERRKCAPISFDHFVPGALAYQAVMLALQTTELRVEQLDMFSIGDRCKIPIDYFGLLPDAIRLTPGFVHTQKVTLNMTWPLRVPHWRRQLRSSARTINVVRDSIAALGKLLRHMPVLRDLDLRWYSICVPRRQPKLWEIQGIRFFDLLSDDAAIPPLHSCALRGLHMAQAPLLRFLQKTSATKIVLQELHLLEGAFAPILNHIFHDQSRFNDILLEDLWQDSGNKQNILCYLPLAAPSGAHHLLDCNSARLVRTGEDVQKPCPRIVVLPDDVPTSSYKEKKGRRQKRRHLYGPPTDAWR